MLKFPPIKQNIKTDLVVYSYKNKNSSSCIYNMFDRNGDFVGMMKAYPEVLQDDYRRFSPNSSRYKSFFIDRLFAYKRNVGVGKAFINIAKKESFRFLCLGNIHTIASSVFDKVNPPYVFFRKMGFDFGRFCSVQKKQVDEAIKLGIKPNVKGDIPMFIEKNVDNNGALENSFYKFKCKFPELFYRL